MSKAILAVCAAVLFTACNSGDTNRDATNDSVVTTTTTTEHRAYTPADGDVTRRDGKVLVMRNGQWVEADADVRLENGTVIDRNGRVVREGRVIEIREGEVVTRTGDFFDRAGNAIENAWDSTKAGVKEIGRKIGDATRKAGDKIENAVSDTNKHK